MNTAQQVSNETDSLATAFNEFVSSLTGELLQYEAGILDKDKEGFFRKLFTGDARKVAEMSNQNSSAIISKSLTIHYLTGLYGHLKSFDFSLAVHLVDHKVLVWASVPDDNEEIYDALFTAEAITNFEFKDSGFSISTTVIDESDNIAIPPQYLSIELPDTK